MVEQASLPTGTKPEGATSEQEASRKVREMFTRIAPRYDLLNHLLSAQMDKRWRARTSRELRPILDRADAIALDLCCGTGDLAFALARDAKARIVGADFSHAMLLRANEKNALQRTEKRYIPFLEADALRLPFADGSFDLVTDAFGFRNLANYEAGLREIARVLAPGGEVGILDFGQPGGALGKLYAVYFRRVLPALGTMISGVRGPYGYLPASVERFPAPAEMLERMRAAGFRDVSWTPYTFGIAGLYRGRKEVASA